MTDHPAADSPPLPSLSAPRLTDLGQLGEYRLVEKLGQGGMGVVYKAVHTELDRVVALKVLPAGRLGDEQASARFQREIKALGRLDHPHIVQAYDARRIGETHFLVLEYVDGTDLETLVRNRGPLPVADACEACRQAALGLQHAHEHGLIHRDVKPSNLMLSRYGQLKILDLGLARICGGADSPTLTVCGQTMGTPDYIAPEQAADSHEVDIRADLYGLGCTLFKLLTGRAPFEDAAHGTLGAKLEAQLREPPPLARLGREVHSGLVAILTRLLAKEPAQRFQTPRELVQALGPWCTGSDLGALLGDRETLQFPSKGVPTVVDPHRGWRRRGIRMFLFAACVAGAAAGLLFVAWPWRTGREEPTERPRRPAPDPARPVAAQAGWIVLSWTPDAAGKPSLWLFRPDGSHRVRITEDPKWSDVHPAFSPDGRRIAFVRTRPLGGGSAIWVCAADGTRARQLVAAVSGGERLVSPVWLSDSQLCYVRDPKIDREPDMELWELNVDDGSTSRVTRFRDVLPGQAALVTGASPDRRWLVVSAQRGALWDSADIYLWDRHERSLSVLWEDPSGDHKDARPRWSPAGGVIAWHHNFTASSAAKATRYGVALSRQQPDGKWLVEFQPDEQARTTPLTWSPDGSRLLCARVSVPSRRAQLLLMDGQFQVTDELFELDVPGWRVEDREFGNLADWAIVPADVPLPSDAGP